MNKFEGANDDTNILEKLTTHAELSGLLNKALQGLIRLLDNNGFTIPNSVARAKEEYRKASDSAWAFLNEHTVSGSEKWVKKQDLYDSYKSCCEANNLKPLSQGRFNTKAVDDFGAAEWIKDGQVRCWRGIGLLKKSFDGF